MGCYFVFIHVDGNFYLGFYKNANNGGNPSIILMTTESRPVSYSIGIPGIGYLNNGTITANNEDIVNLPRNVEVFSLDDQDKGVYLKTSSDRVTVIGQNFFPSSSDTFLALPNMPLSVEEYVYYGISIPRETTIRNWRFTSAVLIVGTEDNTMMKLTVTQPVTIKVNNAVTNLNSGIQYSFAINRLQTVYVESFEDLTGTKIVTNKLVSVFSGHECGFIPLNEYHCDHLIQQMPPTALWGRLHYTVPLSTRNSYTIKVLAANNSTNVNIYCNDTKRTYTVSAGQFITITLMLQEYCAIVSNKKVLVVQFGDKILDNLSDGGEMMTLVPATTQYSNAFKFSTLLNEPNSQYRHFVNIIVIAKYYQPEMIYFTAEGLNKSLNTQEWTPVKVNNVIEAYATKVTISEGVVEILHANPSALMTTIVYGFAQAEGYGHPGGLLYALGMFAIDVLLCNL